MSDEIREERPTEGMEPSILVQDRRTLLRNRTMLVALMLLAMLPLFAAIWLYYGNASSIAGAQTNRGVLLDPPAQLGDLGITRDGAAVDVGDERLWRMILVIPTSCDDACLEQVHLLRQMHVLLGREKDRVIRILATRDAMSPALRATLASRYPDVALTRAPGDVIERALGGRNHLGGEVALDPASLPEFGLLTVDPLGNVIFFHDLAQIPNAVLFDMKRLLRLSNIG